MLGLVKNRWIMAALVVFGSIGLAAWTNLHHSAILASVGPPGRLLVLSFLAGVVFYLWRDSIPLHPAILAGAVILTFLVLASGRTMFLAALPVAYVTVYLGLTRPPPIPFLMAGDYSYGLYLFAYPLQQTYILLFPTARHWWLNSLFALAAGLAYAFFSWNVVEKRVLSHRKRLTVLTERMLQAPVRLKAARWQGERRHDHPQSPKRLDNGRLRPATGRGLAGPKRWSQTSSRPQSWSLGAPPTSRR